MNLLTPRRSPSSTLPLHTQKQCTARGPLGGLQSLSLTTEGSWIHLEDPQENPLAVHCFCVLLAPVPPSRQVDIITIASTERLFVNDGHSCEQIQSVEKFYKSGE